MPNFSFSTAHNFLRFTPESLDSVRKRIAEKKANLSKASEKDNNETQEENIRPQLDLKVLKKLPILYGKPPPWLIGEPLEDVDPYYRDHETFMVLSSRSRIFRFTASKSLFLFSPFHPLRRLAVKILIHVMFIAFITCVVLVNCVFMALNTPPTDGNTTEIIFTSIYTAEFVVKVVARGFVCNEFTYLRDPWNILDFFVLIMTYVAFHQKFGSVSALRIFRILRTLKAVSVIPGLKVIISSLLQSVKKLANVMLLTVFFLAVFALVGLQLFMGNLRYNCVSCSLLTENFNKTDCLLKDTENYGDSNPSKPLLCGFSRNPNKTECPLNSVCVKNKENPDFGYTSFDHLGWAFLSLFRLMTQDSWERLYRQVIRTSGKSYSIFFFIIIFLCSFYLFNLILAVVSMAYEEQNKATLAQTKAREMLLQEAKKVLRKQKELVSQSLLALSNENLEMPSEESENKKRKRRFKRKKKRKNTKSKTYGEDETMFYSPPDKSQKELKEMVMSYQLPLEVLDDPFQRQKLTSAANVISKTMEGSSPEWGQKRQDGNYNDAVVTPSIFMCITTLIIIFLTILWLTLAKKAQNSNRNATTLSLTEAIIITAITSIKLYKQIKEWEESKFEFPPSLKEAIKKHLTWQCCSLWLQIKNILKKIMINPLMELFITLCIITNTMLMALEKLSLSSEQVTKGNNVFTAIFTAEMVLKLIALDPYYYFQSSWNVFDFIVVIIGIINLLLSKRAPIFRTLRIFKLSKFWPALNKLMKIMLKSVGPLGNLTLVLIFTVFIFAVVGKQAFGNYYSAVAANASICNNDGMPNCAPSNSSDATCQLRWHMKDFLHSFLIIFRILCGEWISTMWECMQVAGEGRCIILFMLVLVLGNLVVLNLFIALLLSSFSSSDSETEEDNHKPDPGKALALIHRGLRFVRLFLRDWCCHVFLKKLRVTGTKKKNETTVIERSCDTEPTKEISANFTSKESFENWDKLPWDRKQEDFVTDYREVPTIPLAELETLSVEEMDLSTLENNLRKRREIPVYQGQNRRLSSLVSETTSIWSLDVPKRSDYDTSCSDISTVDQRSPIHHVPEVKKEPQDCFPQVFMKLFPCCRVNTDTFPGNTWWRFRKTCYQIIKHNWFESFIIFMILLSSGALIFEDIYLDKRKIIKNILDYADVFFFCIFFLEMLLKWVAYGFRKYFTDGWCILDFFIVCVSLPMTRGTSKTRQCDGNISTKSLRTLRALRPLRALSRFKGIKVVVNALAGAIPSIGNVLLVCIVLWLPFNILGVQLFGGKFSCWNIENKNSCISKTINFDHVGNGYLALLQVATFKGWMDIMYAAVDSANDNSTQPCFENNIYAYVYFVVFIIFGSFFMLNLFIGVVIDNFNQQRKKISGELIFLSEDQKKYYNALKKLGSKKPHKTIPRPQNQFQGFLFDIVNKQAFELFIISLIFLNVVVMAVEYEGQDVPTGQLLEKINCVFVALFTGECVMKLLALRFYFFKDSWNIFDLVVVILSIISLAATQLWRRLNFPPTILRVIRVIRISRFLRLIRGARGLRTLLFALLMSLPALTNIGLLLFLIMFIYAIFGMANFSCASWLQGIDDIFNFQTFGNSMLCLFQITTSAGWDELLGPMILHKDKYVCAPNINSIPQKNPCVNSKVAIAYFVSYIIISFLIVVNMYIAVIIENLNVATEESTEPLGDDDFEIFYEIWAKFDPKATQFISYSALSNFADALAEPLRIPKPNSQQLLSMDLPIVNGNKIHCLDILFAFTKRVLGESGEMDSFESQIEEKYPEKIAYEPIVTTPKRKQDESAIIIQRAFRMHLLQSSGKEAPQEPYVTISLENIPEEENLSVFSLSANEDSQSNKSQSLSSVAIPPSYSNVTSIAPDIQQEESSNHQDDTK